MTPLMFTSALVQYNSSRNAVSTNIRFRWEYQPGSERFIRVQRGARHRPDPLLTGAHEPGVHHQVQPAVPVLAGTRTDPHCGFGSAAPTRGPRPTADIGALACPFIDTGYNGGQGFSSELARLGG